MLLRGRAVLCARQTLGRLRPYGLQQHALHTGHKSSARREPWLLAFAAGGGTVAAGAWSVKKWADRLQPEDEETCCSPAGRLRAATPAAFYAALRPLEPDGQPPFKLLSSKWVLKRAKQLREAKERGDTAAVRELAIKRRQELPEEAFLTADEVEMLSEEIPDWCGRIAAAAVSYCWETREHPDPEGNTLLALADAIQECHRKKHKHSSHKDPFCYFPSVLGIFWEY